MSINLGGPAFPVSGGKVMDVGSLRDWFAGQALAGLIARHGNAWIGTALDAYAIADAMLKARQQS